MDAQGFNAARLCESGAQSFKDAQVRDFQLTVGLRLTGLRKANNAAVWQRRGVKNRAVNISL